MKLIVGILIAVFVIIGIVGYTNSTDYIVVKVTDKQSVVSNNHNKYLIFTDKEVFENDDSILFGKFNSSDFFNEIKMGETYGFKVVGWRIPFLSAYRNIIEIRKI